MSKSTKKFKKYEYDFEKFLINFKTKKDYDRGILTVLVQIRQRPHKYYERKMFSADFIKNYIIKKYGYKIISNLKGGMLYNYTSDMSKLTKVYEYVVDWSEEIAQKAVENVKEVYDTSKDKSTFADQIKEYRLNNKMTQKMLSEASGITISKISSFENGKAEPTEEEFELIIKSSIVDSEEYLKELEDDSEIESLDEEEIGE